MPRIRSRMCPCNQPPGVHQDTDQQRPARNRPGEFRNASSQGFTKPGRNAATKSMTGTITSAGLLGPRPGRHFSISGKPCEIERGEHGQEVGDAASPDPVPDPLLAARARKPRRSPRSAVFRVTVPSSPTTSIFLRQYDRTVAVVARAGPVDHAVMDFWCRPRDIWAGPAREIFLDLMLGIGPVRLTG